MANTKSAQKALRVSKRRADLNSDIRETYKSVKRDINKNIESGEVKAAEKLVSKYQSEIDTAVKKGILKKNTAARYKSAAVAKILRAKNA
ncbi:MAG TPA: 30S ribosomal protein S20 [Candidatus Dojkabacteria bacterium]|jgi:small subunit ribosomal protein S20